MATDEHAGWRESQLDAPNPFATLNQLTTPFTFSPEGFSGGSASAPAVSSATDASSFGVSAFSSVAALMAAISDLTVTPSTVSN